MKSIISALFLAFMMNGCGTLDEVKKIVYDDVEKEKNSEFKSIKEECANKMFPKLEKESRLFLSDSQEVLVVLSFYSCFVEKRIENLEQKKQ